MDDEKQLHELRVGIMATPAEAERFQEQVIRLLCPDPDHAPPCPIPWNIALLSGDAVDAEAHEELLTQARIEGGMG